MTTAEIAANKCAGGHAHPKNSQQVQSCTTLEDFVQPVEHLIKLPWRKPTLSLNQSAASRGGRYAHNQQVREIKATMLALARAHNLPRNCQYSRVTLHYLPKDNRRRDTDNLAAFLKPLCDALVKPSASQPIGYGMVDDDTPQYMSKQEPVIYRHEKGQKPAMFLQVETWAEVPEGLQPPFTAPEWLLS